MHYDLPFPDNLPNNEGQSAPSGPLSWMEVPRLAD